MNRRMDRSRFNIGTYILQPYARTDSHIRELAECGIDFVVGIDNDRPALDLFEKYGIGAVVSGAVPGWWGGDGSNSGTMKTANPLSLYKEAASKFEDHPAIWGIDVGDEPSSADFPHYGEVINTVNELFPNQFAYLNIYPDYASVAKNSPDEILRQLGTNTYDKYVKSYCKNVDTDYICYDYYLYSHENPHLESALENLRIVSEACVKSGRSMWFVAQVNSLFPELWISENMLRFQAFSAMAYGAEVIEWACWTAGWWSNQVLDDVGNRTEQYEKLKKVNAEIKYIGKEYMKYKCVETYVIDGMGEACEPGSHAFSDICADRGKLLVGKMVSRSGNDSCAIMLCAADDPYDSVRESVNVTFRADGYSIRAVNGESSYKVKSTLDGKFEIRLDSCHGLLLIAE